MDNISSSYHYNDTTPMHWAGDGAHGADERHTESRRWCFQLLNVYGNYNPQNFSKEFEFDRWSQPHGISAKMVEIIHNSAEYVRHSRILPEYSK